MARKTLRVQPISGKFVSATTNSKTINVWLVDPDTNQQGTELPYEDAIEVLTMRHPVCCLVQEKGKDGKYIKQLTDEEEAEIKRISAEHAAGITSQPAMPVMKDANVETLQALVNTQAALLQTQAVQFDEMKAQMAKMQEQMEAMAKASKKSKKTDEE